jgi:REP-associated tyrosine transposase
MPGTQRKRIRLSPDAYLVSVQPFSITLCVTDRKPVFGNPILARDAVDTLTTVSGLNGMELHAYCVMPDHIHILLSPGINYGVIEFVRRFKGRLVAVFRRQGETGRLWQRSFHDRAIRREENLLAVIQYILHNPVRARLVEDWKSYPFSGSPHMDR